MGIAAGLLGIWGICLAAIPFINWVSAFMLGLPAIICGSRGLSRPGGMSGVGKGMAITGLVLGIICFLVPMMLTTAGG